MALLPNSFPDVPPDTTSLWPQALAEPGVRSRFEAELEQMPAEVRDTLVRWLTNGQAQRVRGLVQACGLARQAGATLLSVLGTDRLLFANGEERFAIAPLAFSTTQHPNGKQEDVDRLVKALNGVFSGRRYMLYLRRAVPEGFEPSAVARAVRLWLVSIDRGEWEGRHAIYEDEDISIELTLLDGRAGLAMLVGPTSGMERLSTIDSHVAELSVRHDRQCPDVPLIVSLLANFNWSLPRGFVRQMLYGTADVITTDDAAPFEAWFRPSGISLFSDPACRHLAAIWWLEPDGDDPLAFQSWSNENPWCGLPIPNHPGRRFTLARQQGATSIMHWVGEDQKFGRPS